MSEQEAIDQALANRQDLLIAYGQAEDARRAVDIARDALRAGLELKVTGSAGETRSLGSADQPDARLELNKGQYGASLSWALPWERTAERNEYRKSFIALEQQLRRVEALEDNIKLQIRNDLRSLMQTGESYRIQRQAVAVARRRVESTQLFLEAGRAEIRDVLEAQEALISAQNALTSAIVNYRITELNLQRDMAVLEINEEGLWHEYRKEPNA